MESTLKIPIESDKFIYGTLNYSNPESDKLVILVHGLFDNEASLLMYNAGHYVYQNSFSSFRLNLYHFKSDSRHFNECTLTQHSRDLEKVINYFKGKYNSIFLIGHSFGGLTVINADLSNIKAISLWEPSSFISHPPELYIKYDKKLEKYIFSAGYDIIVEKKYMDDLVNYPNELDLIRKVNCPVQIAYADGPKGAQIESSIRYYNNIKSCKKILQPIDGASHSFREEGTGNTLYRKTADWFISTLNIN